MKPKKKTAPARAVKKQVAKAIAPAPEPVVRRRAIRKSDKYEKAKTLFLNGVDSPTEIAKTLEGIKRQTVADWIERGEWHKLRATEVVTPQQIAAELMNVMSEMLREIKEKKRNGEPVALSSVKEMFFYSKALKQLDEEWDIRGSMLTFSRRFIEFVGMLPSDVLPTKKQFIRDLRDVMPRFMSHVEATP